MAAGIADEILVQVAYAIGVARPVSMYVNTYGTAHVEMSDAEIAERLNALFDMRPSAIENRLKLRNPIYEETAAYGHVGRQPETVTKHYSSKYEGEKTVTVRLFKMMKTEKRRKTHLCQEKQPPEPPMAPGQSGSVLTAPGRPVSP